MHFLFCIFACIFVYACILCINIGLNISYAYAFLAEQNALKIRLAETNSLKNELGSQFHKDFCTSGSLRTAKSNAVSNARLKLCPSL